MPFCADHKSMYFMSTRFLKDKMNGVHVQRFKIAYICDTTDSSHKTLVKLCHEVHHMWWGNQYLELQEWKDSIKPNKKQF